jgi:hypothetical protein
MLLACERMLCGNFLMRRLEACDASLLATLSILRCQFDIDPTFLTLNIFHLTLKMGEIPHEELMDSMHEYISFQLRLRTTN